MILTKKDKLRLLSAIEDIVEILKPVINRLIKQHVGTKEAIELNDKLIIIEDKIKTLKK